MSINPKHVFIWLLVAALLATSVAMIPTPVWAEAKPGKSHRLSWQAAMKKAGWVRLGKVDGHRHCYGLIGDTTHVICWDGYQTTS